MEAWGKTEPCIRRGLKVVTLYNNPNVAKIIYTTFSNDKLVHAYPFLVIQNAKSYIIS